MKNLYLYTIRIDHVLTPHPVGPRLDEDGNEVVHQSKVIVEKRIKTNKNCHHKREEPIKQQNSGHVIAT